jgi:hypothetical protein
MDLIQRPLEDSLWRVFRLVFFCHQGRNVLPEEEFFAAFFAFHEMGLYLIPLIGGKTAGSILGE